MITLLILLLVYFISAYQVYKWIQKSYYHPNGIFKTLQPRDIEIFLTFYPIINTIVGLVSLFLSPYKENYKPKKQYNEFTSLFEVNSKAEFILLTTFWLIIIYYVVFFIIIFFF